MMVIFLLLPLLAFAQFIKVDDATLGKLDIRLYEVKPKEEKLELKLPARVEEYASLVAEVHSPITGVVKRLYVKEGDKVKKGSPLALVYSSQIADLQAQVRMAYARLRTAQETLKREELLYKEEVIPYARYYSAKVEYEKAKAEYEALLSSLRSYGEVVENALLVRSPISGVVVQQKVFVGSGVDPSKEMFKIHNHEKVWVYAYALPQDTERVKKGTKGYVLWSGKRVEGFVDYISHEVDPNTKRVAIRLLVNNPKDLLRPGQMVDVVLEVGKVQGFWLPSQAVQRVKGQEVVFVRVQGGFQVRRVNKLKEENNMVLVEGLKAGERVAVSGLVFLKAQAER